MIQAHEQLRNDVEALLAQRIGHTTVVEALSQRGNKGLYVMEEADGSQYIERRYQTGAEREFSEGYDSPDLTLNEGLTAMQNMYAAAGLSVVKSSVLPFKVAGEIVIVSDYLPNIIGVQHAKPEAKREAVRGLACLLDPQHPYLPTTEALVSDLFMYYSDAEGNQHPIVVDVDPRLKYKKPGFFSIGSEDSIRATHIEMVAYLIRSWGENDQENAVLAREFLAGMSSIEDNSVFDGMQTLMAITKLHQMTQPELLAALRQFEVDDL